MKKMISVPFFIRFEELRKKVKEVFGQDYEIVDIFQDENRKWQIVVEERPDIRANTDTYRKGRILLKKLNVRGAIGSIQRN